MEILTRARMSSGYAVAAPFPWGGVTSQGNIDVRAMLRRQDYSDWQRSFSYWDEKNLPPPTDRTRRRMPIWRKSQAISTKT